MNFEVNGKNYASTKLDVMLQLNLARRLAPVLSAIPDEDTDGNKIEKPMISRIMDAVGDMSDADVNYIVVTCLSVVQKITEGQPPIALARGGHIMDSSLTLPDLLKIVQAVIEDSIGGFFGAAGTPA